MESGYEYAVSRLVPGIWTKVGLCEVYRTMDDVAFYYVRGPKLPKTRTNYNKLIHLLGAVQKRVDSEGVSE